MPTPLPGRLIALEGIDGSGKSTQARILERQPMLTVTAEPGATALGTRLRHLLLDPGLPAVATRTEALLLAADRAQHVAEVVEPALAAGRWVVTDRFSGSTLAYQGYGRGLDLDDLRRLVAWATGGIEPDLNLLVDIPLDVAGRRRAGAAADRLESLGDDFLERVRSGYLALAAADPERWAVIDGTGHPDEVAHLVRAVLAQRLGTPPEPGR